MNTLQLIGQGAFDKVYKIGNIVGKPINYENRIISTSSFREIVFLNYLSHKNVVYPIKIDNKGLYINYGGKSLKYWYTVKKFKWFELRKIIIQILKALDYIHKNNIIHCDIKPENILMNGGHVYICDFNISSLNNKHNSGSVYTIVYRPLETINNYYSEKSDIWALGCTLYEIYTQKPMFKYSNVNNQAIYTNITNKFGTPSDDIIDRYKLREFHSTHINREFVFTDCQPLNELLKLMFNYDMDARPSACDLLKLLGQTQDIAPVVIHVRHEFKLIKFLYDIQMISYTIYSISSNLLYYLINTYKDFENDYLYQWIVVCCCSMLSDGDKIKFHDIEIIRGFNVDIEKIDFGVAIQDILELTKFNLLTVAT